MRVRLTAPRTRYRAGETVRLVLEIQNVSDKARAIEEPDLSPVIEDPDAAADGWAITAAWKSDEPQIIRGGRFAWKRMRRERDVALLGVGQTLRIEIEAVGDLLEKKLEKQRREDEPRKEELYFPDAKTPGVWELRATFTPPTRRKRAQERGWPGQPLTTPPVRIEIQK
jgi:hypothetical protein